MIERDLEYAGYLLRFRTEQPSKKAILLLHGFPAFRATKNLDLADLLFRHFDRDVYLLHYRGLGDSPGTFQFTDSIEEAGLVAQRIAERLAPRSLTIVGHSWGGLVATNVAARMPEQLGAMILLSPFVFAQPELQDWLVANVRNELPNVFGATPEAEVRANWEQVKAQYLPLNIAPLIPRDFPVGIVQAKNDPTTPDAHTQQLLPLLPPGTHYRELEMDHSFTQDRRRLAREVAEMVRALGQG